MKPLRNPVLYVRVSDLNHVEQAIENDDTPLEVHLLADDLDLSGFHNQSGGKYVVVEENTQLPTELKNAFTEQGLSFVTLGTEDLGKVRRGYGC